MKRGGYLPTPDTSTDASSSSLSTSYNAVTKPLRGHRFLTTCYLLARSFSLDPRTIQRKFYACVNGMRRWRGYKRCVFIGMPLDCLFVPEISALQGIPHALSWVSPQQRFQPTPLRVDYRRHHGIRSPSTKHLKPAPPTSLT